MLENLRDLFRSGVEVYPFDEDPAPKKRKARKK